MYAIIESGGKQYRVEKGDTIDIELVTPKGGEVELDKVLMLSKQGKIEIGQPYVKGVKVLGKVIEPSIKDDKVVCFKYKRKVNYRRTKGHRQQYTRIKIDKIEAK